MPNMSENPLPPETFWEPDASHPPEPSPQTAEAPPTTPKQAEDTITFRRSHFYAMLVPLAFVLGLTVGYLFWGRSGNTGSTNTISTNSAATTGNSDTTQTQTDTSGQDQQIVRYKVPVDDDPYYGPENAEITIVEFSDFQCPYCRKWYSEVYPRLLDTYSGKIKFVYRDFPLTSIHPDAFPAAEAANCAGDQGVYWPYHDKLFGMELGLGTDAYQQYAEQLGVNMDQFNACLDEGKYKEEIQADFEFAAQLGVRSTPTFFINGIAVVGAQPFEVFQQVIDKELAGEIP